MRSSRDPEDLRLGLQRWLASKVGGAPVVGELGSTSATGMSSETLLFDATWLEDGSPRTERLVARLAPAAEDAPVFPVYDLPRQFRTITDVGTLTDVPVPKTWWCEPDPAALGTPFFVMGRVDGEPPPDVMPYNFGGSWLSEATPDEQRTLQDATVDVLVGLHAIEGAAERFGYLAFDTTGETALRRHVRHTEDWYGWVRAHGLRSGLIERAFRWLEDHRPERESEPVLVWGDSRIGNVLYEGFRPVAVLDWEMAAIGPRELDVAWLIYAHEVFEHLAKGFGADGMPDFMRSSDVVARYEARSGTTLGDLHFYRVYAAVQYAIVFLRTGFRGVHFGEREMPPDVEDFLYNRGQLEHLIA